MQAKIVLSLILSFGVSLIANADSFQQALTACQNDKDANPSGLTLPTPPTPPNAEEMAVLQACEAKGILHKPPHGGPHPGAAAESN